MNYKSLLFVVLVAGLILAPMATEGQETRRYTEIQGTGQSLYRIAIPPVLDGGAGASTVKTLQAVMNRDMVLIGLFKVLSPKGFLADLKKEGVGIELEPWVNVGAQGVIKARAMAIGNKISVDFYLYDVGKGRTPVLTKTYRGPKRSIRRLAHKFGNDVVFYYTKEKGIFTTKMTFATTSRRSRTSYIYVMDYDGYGVYKVSRTGRQNVLPSWSKGGAIAYTSYLWKNPDLYLVGGGGGRARRISKRAGLNTGAAFAPNGNIALTLSKDGNAELYLISSSGKMIRRLTNNIAIDTSPTWSPGGNQLAFVSNRGGSPQIYVMSAGGGGARRITFRGSYNQEPDWCPRKDKSLVAFTGRDDGGNYDIFTVNTKSGEVKRLTQGQGSNKSPTWAPNGKILAFTSSRGGVWIMNEDGLNQHQVYRGGAVTPAWSR